MVLHRCSYVTQIQNLQRFRIPKNLYFEGNCLEAQYFEAALKKDNNKTKRLPAATRSLKTDGAPPLFICHPNLHNESKMQRIFYVCIIITIAQSSKILFELDSYLKQISYLKVLSWTLLFICYLLQIGLLKSIKIEVKLYT